ncbi:MAG: hypothetical protein ACI8ZX_001960 [Planctomycetota bacterium]|jgi:hypothetical protein
MGNIKFNSTNGTRNMIALNDQNEILIVQNAIQIGATIRCIKA